MKKEIELQSDTSTLFYTMQIHLKCGWNCLDGVNFIKTSKNLILRLKIPKHEEGGKFSSSLQRIIQVPKNGDRLIY